MRPIFAIFNFLRGLKTTKFHEVPAGTAVKMYGEDSNGDLIKDDVPSGGSGGGTSIQTAKVTLTAAQIMTYTCDPENGDYNPYPVLPELPSNQQYMVVNYGMRCQGNNTFGEGVLLLCYGAMPDTLAYGAAYMYLYDAGTYTIYNSIEFIQGGAGRPNNLPIGIAFYTPFTATPENCDPIDFYITYYILDL